MKLLQLMKTTDELIVIRVEGEYIFVSEDFYIISRDIYIHL